METYDAFVAYSHADEALVRPVVKLLSIGRRRIFWDDQIEPGERWPDAIRRALTSSTVFVVLWCCHSAESEHVGEEVELAHVLEKPIAPVILCSYPMRALIRDHQHIDFQDMAQHVCERHDWPVLPRMSQRRSGGPRSPAVRILGGMFGVILMLLAFLQPFTSELHASVSAGINWTIGVFGLALMVAGLQAAIAIQRSSFSGGKHAPSRPRRRSDPQPLAAAIETAIDDAKARLRQ